MKLLASTLKYKETQRNTLCCKLSCLSLVSHFNVEIRICDMLQALLPDEVQGDREGAEIFGLLHPDGACRGEDGIGRIQRGGSKGGVTDL